MRGGPRPYAVAIVVGLLAVTPAAAHVTASPARIPAAATTRVTIVAQDERPGHRTTEVRLEPTSDLDIQAVSTPAGALGRSGDSIVWSSDIEDSEAGATVVLDVTPGSRSERTSLRALQVYDDGERRSWSVELVVAPAVGANTPREHLVRAVVVGVVGVGGVVAGLIVLRRLRRRALQEE